MYPYFKSWDLVHCPDASVDRDSHDLLDTFDTLEGNTGRPDYSFNIDLCGINEALIYAPSNAVTFADASAFSGNMFEPGIKGPYRAGVGGDRHFNGYNISYYDGHVKWTSVSTTIGGGGISKR